MDTENPVVKLCVEGIQAEMAGKSMEALALYQQAWDIRADDFDACIAAHYIARHQQSAEDIFRWNQEALDRAKAVNDERVAAFYPSLYLNLGHAKEMLGSKSEARSYYEQAAERLANVGDDAYSDVLREGVMRALERSS